ncbi:hypothetical protein X975_21174, partial [Stegodyphus mimosarum]
MCANNKFCNVDFKLDTGAEVNILSLYVLNNLKLKPKLNETDLFLTAYGNFKLKSEGTLVINCSTERLKNVPLQCYVADVRCKLEREGIVLKVNKPTDWVQSLVVVEKPNGNLRLCLDPSDLNKVIKKEHYQIPSPDDIISRLEVKKVFSVVDLKDRFWHVPLDETSSELCTFNTPYGRYKFNKLPFGISSTPEIFQKRNQKVFGDIKGVEVYFDDIIIARSDEVTHDIIISKVLERARYLNIKFNPDKLHYRVLEDKYVGQIISESGVKADPSHIEAIIDMPTPKSKTEVRSLTNNEKNYAQIKKELLAVVFSFEKYHNYVYGRKITVQSDHKPLMAVVKKPLHKISRMQRMILKLLKYDFEINYVPGNQMCVADTLSRACHVNETISDDPEMLKVVYVISKYLPMSERRVVQFRYGIANEVVCDNNPCNSYLFKKFAEDWNFKLKFSSPRYPQSNELAEKAVEIVEKHLKKSARCVSALLAELDLDSLTESQLLRYLKQLEKDRNSLYNELRDKEWKLDQESKTFHKYNDTRKAYMTEITEAMLNLEAMKSRLRMFEGSENGSIAKCPRHLKYLNILPDQRVIDPKKGPIKKTAAVRSLPKLNTTDKEFNDDDDLLDKQITTAQAQEIYCDKECKTAFVIGKSLERHTGDSATLLSLPHPHFDGGALWGWVQKSPSPPPLPQPLARTFGIPRI